MFMFWPLVIVELIWLVRCAQSVASGLPRFARNDVVGSQCSELASAMPCRLSPPRNDACGHCERSAAIQIVYLVAFPLIF